MEHHLAKVGAAGSNPVSRSLKCKKILVMLGFSFFSLLLPGICIIISTMVLNVFPESGETGCVFGGNENEICKKNGSFWRRDFLQIG